MQHVTRKCSNCNEMTKCRHREVSDQSWLLLLHWGEINRSVIGQPVCDSCYRDMRDILIDRAEEIEEVLKSGVTLETAGSPKSVASEVSSLPKKDTKKPKTKISKAG